MSRLNRTLTIARPRWKWYLSGVVVIIGALVLFAYITFVQASAVFAEGDMSIEAFQYSLGERMAKGLMLILTMGLFLFFFAVQDYRVTFNNLLERLSFSQPDLDALSPTDRNTGIPAIDGINSDLTLIESSVESMLSQNQDFRSRLDAQRNEQRDYYLLQLMKGWMKDTTVARRICRSFDLELLDSEHLVVVIGAAHLDEASRVQEEIVSMAYLRAKRLLEQMLRQLCSLYALRVDDKLACVVVPADGEQLDASTMSDLLCAIKLNQQLVYDETRITLLTALGSIETGIMGVRDSYAEAAENYEYALLIGDNDKVAMERSRAGQDEDEHLTRTWFELEKRFFNCVEAQEYVDAEALYREMLGCGYINRAPSFALAQHRMSCLANILLNALEQAGALVGWDVDRVQASRENVLSCRSLVELRDTATEVFDSLGYQSVARHQQSPYLRIMEIIDYVETNYSDANLCVNHIATNFGINPSYLSRNFKKLMAVGLSSYIRHMRVQKAKELLKDSSVSVKQAAELVGFNSVLTMNRAFRKQEGTTAGRLRKTQPETEREAE